MALPFTISGVKIPRQNIKIGPYRSSSGNYYIIFLDSTDNSIIEAWKATDPSSSWSNVGTNPDLTNNVISMWTTKVDDIIHVATQESTTARVAYHAFNMANDTWSTSNEEVAVPASSPGDSVLQVSIAIRSDGDRIILYQGASDTISHSTFRRTKYAIWEGVSWTVNIAVDNGGSVNYSPSCSVLGSSDRVHFFFFDGVGNDCFQRTLLSNNTLETFPAAFETTGPTALTQGIFDVISYVDGSATKIRCFYSRRITGDEPFSAEFDSADVPSIITEQINNVSGTNAIAAISGFTSAGITAEGKQIYAIWASSTDGDAWLNEKEGSSTWPAEKELLNAITLTGGISLNTYKRDNKVVLAYTYNDGTNNIYNELLLRVEQNEIVKMADTITVTLTVSGQAYSRTQNEIVKLKETKSVLLVAYRSLTERVKLYENKLNTSIYSRTKIELVKLDDEPQSRRILVSKINNIFLSESISVTLGVAGGGENYSVTKNEKITLTELFIKSSVIKKSPYEIIKIKELVKKSINKSIKDKVEISEPAIRNNINFVLLKLDFVKTIETISLTKSVLYSINNNELIKLIDRFNKNINKSAKELIKLLESLFKNSTKTSTEVVKLRDLINQLGIYSKSTEDLVELSEVVTKQISKNRVELVKLADSFNKTAILNRFLNEVIILKDNIFKYLNTVKTDKIILSDSRAITLTALTSDRSAIELVKLSEKLFFFLNKTFVDRTKLVENKLLNRSLFRSDKISLSENINFYKTKNNKDLVELSDITIKNINKSIKDIIELTETTNRAVSKNQQELIKLKEITNLLGVYYKSPFELIKLSDSILREVSKLKTEKINIADYFSKNEILSRISKETILLKETLLRLVTTTKIDKIKLTETFGAALVKSLFLIDEVELKDNLNKSLNKNLIDKLLFRELKTRLAIYNLNRTDRILLIDKLNKEFSKFLTERTNLSENISLRSSFFRLKSDAVKIKDVVNSLAFYTIKPTDRVLAREIKTIISTTLKEFTDGINLNELVNKNRLLNRFDKIVVSEKLNLYKSSDRFDKTNADDNVFKEFSKRISEIVLISDKLSKQYSVSKNDILKLAESISRAASINRLFVDKIDISEKIERTSSLLRSRFEIIKVSDQTNRAIDKIIKDTILLVDSISKKAVFNKNRFDTIKLIETIIVSARQKKLFGDKIIILDNIFKHIDLERKELLDIKEKISKAISKDRFDVLRLREYFDPVFIEALPNRMIGTIKEQQSLFGTINEIYEGPVTVQVI